MGPRLTAPHRLTVSICIVLAVGLSAPVWGDVVINDQGRRLEGQIVREAAVSITLLRADGSEVIIPRSRIRSIERSETWENHLALGDRALEQRDFHRAEQQYEQALQAEPPSSEIDVIRERLAVAQGMLSERLTEERAEETRVVDDLLERARSEVRDEPLRALATLEQAMRQRPNARQEAEMLELRADALYLQAESLLDHYDHVGALEVLQELREIAPTHRRGMDLYERILQNQPLDTPEAVAEIEAILSENPERHDLAARVGEYYSRRHQFETALPYLLIAAESELHFSQIRGWLRRAMIDQVEQANLQGDYRRAIDLYMQLLDRFPGEDENYLNYLIYHMQDRELATDDFDGRIRLAVQCREAGFDEWARTQMQIVLDQNPNHPGALDLHRGYAEQAFDEAATALQEGRYAVARMLFQRFIERYNYPDLVEQADLLLADAQVRLRESERQRRERAAELVDLGDEYMALARADLNRQLEREVRERTTYILFNVNTIDTIKRNLRRAIQAYETALSLDPTVGPLQGGGVAIKLADARDLLRAFTNPTLPGREPQFSRR